MDSNSPNRGLICVSIPLENLSTISEKIIKAKEQGAEVIEIRLDYYPKILETNVSDLKPILECCNIPIIFTLRSASEGGKNSLHESPRIEYIKRLIELKPQYVDLEARLPAEILKNYYHLAIQNSVKIIYSFHDFEKTPNIVNAQTLIYSIMKKCEGLEDENNPNAILKVVFTAKGGQDNLVAVQIIRWVRRMNKNIICFCMGEKGVYSRIESIKAGAYLTFASIDKATAPGQLNINELKKELGSLL